MADEELIEAYTVPEIFVDGFTAHSSRDGVMTCVGYRRMAEGKIVVLRLVWPAINTIAAIDDANAAMHTADAPINGACGGNSKKGVH